MSLRTRIFKNLAALLTGRLVSVLSQIVLPPVFLWRYGAIGFGEWSALYGTVGALFMLNFGIQTYVNQDLAMRYQRGELESFHLRQSTTLRILLGIVVMAALLLLGIFALPIDSVLRLHLSRADAQWTLYLLCLFILLTIPFGYLAGFFLAVARAHRSTNWITVQQLLAVLGLMAGVVLHLPFPALAEIQVVTLLLSILGVYADLRTSAPEVAPSLRGWDGNAARDILRGSGYFALLETSTFLTYSLPLLLLQRLAGPVAVTGFVLMRTIFSMARQALSMFTQSMGPEITNLYGLRDWPALERLYDYSERVVFFLIGVVNVLVLMASPVLITVWVHKKGGGLNGHVSQLFAVMPYVLTSAISMLISFKEHKYQFQISTNRHEEWAKAVFVGYSAMCLVSIGTVHVAGVNGFLWTWLTVEVLQAVRLIQLNSNLFAHVKQIDSTYVTRLGAICLLALLIAMPVLERTSTLPLFAQTGIALVASGLVAGMGWRLFRVRTVAADMLGRLRKRLA